MPRRADLGDLLESVISVAALLLMVAIGVTVWLAAPLAVVTYIGVGLVRTRRTGEEETPADTDPQKRIDEGSFPFRGWIAGEWPLDPAVAARFKLTPEECEILPLVCQGLTNKEIADRLFKSHRTVENQVSSILRRLGLKNRREIVPFAVQEGLLRRPLPPNGSE